MLIAHVLPLSCYKKKLRKLSNCCLKFARSESSNKSVWEILQEKVYKTRITDLDLSTTPLTNGCRNDDTIQLGPLHSQSLFQFVHISDAYFVHVLWQYSPHSVINGILIWRISKPQLRWDQFRSFFL